MIIIGYKYSSFEEYIQLNYLDEITEAMEEYIKEKELNAYNNEIVYALIYIAFKI